MENLTCTQCGGQIDRERMICPYCGTKYKLEANENIIRVETFNNPVRTYKSTIVIDDYDVRHDPDLISRVAINNLAHNLAEALKENMELHKDYDPGRMQHRITARIRIVEPKHLF